MPQRDFRAHATQICHHLLVEGGIVDRSTSGPAPFPLESSWPVVCSSIANATLAQSDHAERDSDLLRRLLRAGVIPRLFSIVLDYPAPPPCDKPSEVSFDCGQDCGGVLVDLEASVWYGSLGALSSLRTIESMKPRLPEATQHVMEWREMMPRIVQWLSDSTPWLNPLPPELEEEGRIWKWCLNILVLQIRPEHEENENPTQGYLEVAISLVFALSSDKSGVRRHDHNSARASVALLGQLFRHLSDLRVGAQSSRLMPSPVVGDRIVGITFANLIRHLCDMARKMRSIMEPAECYRLEVQQMTTLSLIIYSASDAGSVLNPRPPALINAFASHHIITYSASLIRDSRAEQLRTLSSSEPLYSFEFSAWGVGIFSSWGLLIREAWLNADNRLAVELVDSNFMFILEKWSLLGSEDLDFGMIDTTAACALESVKGDGERQHTLQHQLAVIGRRILDHPKASPKVRDIWIKARMGPSFHVQPPNDIRSCAGCISLEAATLRCSKCKDQTYCSKTCQKTDWKSHKRRCKQSSK